MLQRIAAILRPALVLLAIFLLIGFAGIAFRSIRTLQTLTAVEAERDRWQRPADVIRAMNIQNGSTVVDFGSGAGYFALKLSDAVGPNGQVVAVDLRRFSLLFLHLRAFLQGKHNIQIALGEPDDPHLPEAQADSVLILNTYHELNNHELILRHVFQALRRGGRLVIVDPSQGDEKHHGIPADAAETDLKEQGFEIESRDDSFIKMPRQTWWLIVAGKL